MKIDPPAVSKEAFFGIGLTRRPCDSIDSPSPDGPRCRRCGSRIRWERLDGRNYPVDRDGVSHRTRCPGDSARRPNARIGRIDVRPMTAKSRPITGVAYRPSCNRCDAMPWGSCACSFQEATCSAM